VRYECEESREAQEEMDRDSTGSDHHIIGGAIALLGISSADF
jgi:hypothetical protein